MFRGRFQQNCHGSAFINKDADVALWLRQAQGMFQRDERRGKVSLRPVGKRLQHADLDYAAHPSTCFCGLLKAIQKSYDLMDSAVGTVSCVLGNQHPR